jgi:hypothetical protein
MLQNLVLDIGPTYNFVVVATFFVQFRYQVIVGSSRRSGDCGYEDAEGKNWLKKHSSVDGLSGLKDRNLCARIKEAKVRSLSR